MKKITNVFTYNKVASNGDIKLMACINNEVFVSAHWLETKCKISSKLFQLLIGSSIDATFFIKDEVISGDAEVEVLCTEEGKVVKDFNVQYSFELMCALLKAA